LALITNSLQAGSLLDEFLGILGQAVARASEAGHATHA
jgi:hypothetical protein